MVTIEGYELFAELQRGPWIALYKAFDPRRGETVLIKALVEGGAPEALREQLAVECDLSRRLSHPNLRKVFAAGTVQDRPYLALEYVEGPTLAEIIKRNLPFEICAWITREVAKAIGALHERNIIHRDIKPQNIFISAHGEVKLGDLGLAQDFSAETQSVAGTPAYLAPEIVLGGEANAQSDLFSLGAVLYEMLTGEPPFADRTTSAVLHRIANFDPLPVERMRPDTPVELARLCQMLLIKDPGKRSQDAESVIALLDLFEREYELRTSPTKLAQFIEQPETYTRAHFQPAAKAPQAHHLPAELVPKSRSRRWLPALLVFAVTSGALLTNLNKTDTETSAAYHVDLSFIKDQPATANKISKTPDSRTEIMGAGESSGERMDSSLMPANPNATVFGNSEEPAPPQISDVTLSTEANNSVEALGPTLSAPGSAPSALGAKSILIITEPFASVVVEDDSIGTTPLTWRPVVAAKVYDVRFHSPGWPPVRMLMTPAILDSDTLRVNLRREVGFLDVVVNPWGEVWIDGQPLDTTPLSSPITLAPGLHEVSVRHPQLGDRSQRLVVSKGDTLRKTFNLFLP